jgi:hypothetical protein
MQIKRLIIDFMVITLLLSSVSTISVSSEKTLPPFWNKDWSYRQEIKLPIPTDTSFAKFQPIDIKIEFAYSCWAENEKDHSVRVCCWDGYEWRELESQIYNLDFADTCHIKRCGLVFLIPEIADGNERYFLYYDDEKKSSVNYIDHVGIEDAYYYIEPISGISLEGYYYKITEDGYCIYSVGQKGQILNRRFSHSIIKMREGAKEFDTKEVEQGVSFYFSYFHGVDEEDEIASDQVFVSKDVCVDGNLMVEFGIISESSGKNLRTTNVYKYYYSPGKEKRICAHVKHEVSDRGVVTGIENVDGHYGVLGSLKSRSARVEKMVFGDILPYLHVYCEDGNVREYRMNVDPDSKERQWIISHKDDCDLGSDAWVSYDEGENGKVYAVLFSSNKDVVKHGTRERDGIQVKVNEKEYLSIVGTDVDYASISFGRNSYEKGGVHDVDIPDDLVVEFDAEFFTTEESSYKDVIEEGKIYRTLVKHRYRSEEDLFFGEQNVYTLTVFPMFLGRILSYPYLADVTGFALPVTWVELYSNDTLLSSGVVNKSFLGLNKIKFPGLNPGDYVVKVYRRSGNISKRYIGAESVKIEEDASLNVYCTWQKNIGLTYHDQRGKSIEDIELVISKSDKDFAVAKNVTDTAGKTTLSVPFDLFDSYVLKAFYKGFIVYDKEISKSERTVDIGLDLYDLTVDVKDKLGLRPGVDVRPFLTSSEMYTAWEITPDDVGLGRYLFRDLPVALYELRISYGGFDDIKKIDLPGEGDSTSIIFTATFDVSTDLFDSRGNSIQDNNQKMDIIRSGRRIYDSIRTEEVVSLPPGEYTINVYSEDKLIATKDIELTSNRNVKIITIIEPFLPVVVTGVVLLFIVEIFLLILFKRISMNTFLKFLAMSLILLSLFQPWWVFNASSNDVVASKNSEMFIVPQSMIESVTYKGTQYLDLATIPELFIQFLGVLLIIVVSGFILLGASFVSNIVLKRRFYKLLIFASILFLILVVLAFSIGMSKVSEISLGSLHGEGLLDVKLPDGETIYMYSNWGLGSGFYLCIFAALIAASAGASDFLRKKKWTSRFLNKKKK